MRLNALCYQTVRKLNNGVPLLEEKPHEPAHERQVSKLCELFLGFKFDLFLFFFNFVFFLLMTFGNVKIIWVGLSHLVEVSHRVIVSFILQKQVVP